MRRCADRRLPAVGWAVFLLAGAGCGPAPLATLGSLAVVDGHASPSVGGGMAAFVSLHNRGETPDTVFGFETPDAAHAMLHRNEAMGDMIRMVHQAELVLEPGAVVRMRSGELHLMLDGMRREFVPGDSLQVSLVLSGERTLEVMLPVEPFGAREP